jgi:hypothetical protein
VLSSELGRVSIGSTVCGSDISSERGVLSRHHDRRNEAADHPRRRASGDPPANPSRRLWVHSGLREPRAVQDVLSLTEGVADKYAQYAPDRYSNMHEYRNLPPPRVTL